MRSANRPGPRPAVALLTLPLALTACGEDPPAAPGPPPDHAYEFESLAQEWDCCYTEDEQTEIPEARLFVVRDAGEWAALWSELEGCVLPAPPAPEVDFGEFLVVAVVNREEPYLSTIRIDSVRRQGEDLVVRATRSVGQWWPMLSRPYHAVYLRRTEVERELLVVTDG